VIEQKLIKKLQNKSAIISIVGLGYVGLPLALRFTETGFNVIGFDIDPAKIKALDAGPEAISNISRQSVSNAL
jgi:UDP-N-acetyl-D-glucosamine dehydrogenase